MEKKRFKLGKLAAKYDPNAMYYAKYRAAGKLWSIPTSFGKYALVGSDWGMLGNDEQGDCFWAGSAHETMLWTAEGAGLAAFSTEGVEADYHAVTGEGDNGTDVLEGYKFRKKTGIQDANGMRHLLGAALTIEPGNVQEIEEAAWLCGAVGLGLQLPESAQDQFGEGKPWTVTSAPIEGGHYVPVVGKLGAYILIVTWGRIQKVTTSFIRKYNDEAYALVSQEDVVNGTLPNGLNSEQFNADLAELQA